MHLLHLRHELLVVPLHWGLLAKLRKGVHLLGRLTKSKGRLLRGGLLLLHELVHLHHCLLGLLLVGRLVSKEALHVGLETLLTVRS